MSKLYNPSPPKALFSPLDIGTRGTLISRVPEVTAPIVNGSPLSGLGSPSIDAPPKWTVFLSTFLLPSEAEGEPSQGHALQSPCGRRGPSFTVGPRMRVRHLVSPAPSCVPRTSSGPADPVAQSAGCAPDPHILKPPAHAGPQPPLQAGVCLAVTHEFPLSRRSVHSPSHLLLITSTPHVPQRTTFCLLGDSNPALAGANQQMSLGYFSMKSEPQPWGRRPFKSFLGFPSLSPGSYTEHVWVL